MVISNSGPEIEIRMLRDLSEMLLIEELQREIWAYGEPGSDHPYPARALFALVESGGLVSLALRNDEPAGFCVAWLGRHPEERITYLHSQLLGVRVPFRRLGIGRALKLHQRQYALREGLSLVRWTFDPLRAANAGLNLRKLGAIASEFRSHYYGDLGSRFGSGDRSDRLRVDWFIDSRRVAARLSGEAPPPILEAPVANRWSTVEVAGHLLPRIEEWEIPTGCEALGVAIPADFDLLKSLQPGLASAWRTVIGELLGRCLENGYRVSDISDLSQTVAIFHLTRRPLQRLLEEA